MRRFTGILLLMTLVTLSRGGVNYRTGNFFITYTDVEFKGAGTDITRSYNSFTSSVGLFGFGWGTQMETRLFALPDGTLCIKWWGGGAKDIFEPSAIDNEGLFLMINEIIKYEIKKDKLENNPVDILNRKAELVTDAEKRTAKYIDLVEKKVIPPWTQSTLIKKTWKRNVNQVMQWDGHQYSLQNWEDRYEFNSLGLMSEAIEPGTSMKLFYTGNLLSGVLIDKKHRCNIQTDSSGKIIRLFFTDSTGLKEAVFTYDDNDNLVYSKDIGNNEYWFRYDKAHNMTRITYTDSTFKEITYDPATYKAIREKERNGQAVTYQYPFFYTQDGKINYLHYATRIKRYDSTGALTFSEYYEYESRTKPDGTDYLFRRLIRTDTLYDEALYNGEIGNAYYRKKNNKEAWSRYDSKKRCVYLRINDTVFICSYNLLDKTNQFWLIDSSKKDTTLYSYTYDNAGKLKDTRKNNIMYQIKGSRREGQIEVKKNDRELLIGFKDGKPYYVRNKEWGITLLEEEKKSKPDSLSQTEDDAPIINKTDSVSTTTNTTLTNDENNRLQNMDMDKPEPTKKDEAKKKQKAVPEAGMGKTDKQRLKELYEEYKDVMEAKVIRHEWIWEKL